MIYLRRGDNLMKKRIRVGSSVDPELWKNLQLLSKETRIPVSRLLDEAIADLLVKHGKK